MSLKPGPMQTLCHNHVWAAGMLERQTADSLAPGHLRTLLAFLCDQALDAGALRDALAVRQESADEARANMRKATMEEKRKINVCCSPGMAMLHDGATCITDHAQSAACMWRFAIGSHICLVCQISVSLLGLFFRCQDSDGNRCGRTFSACLCWPCSEFPCIPLSCSAGALDFNEVALLRTCS